MSDILASLGALAAFWGMYWAGYKRGHKHGGADAIGRLRAQQRREEDAREHRAALDQQRRIVESWRTEQ